MNRRASGGGDVATGCDRAGAEVGVESQERGSDRGFIIGKRRQGRRGDGRGSELTRHCSAV